jgi:hypothetical protein
MAKGNALVGLRKSSAQFGLIKSNGNIHYHFYVPVNKQDEMKTLAAIMLLTRKVSIDTLSA